MGTHYIKKCKMCSEVMGQYRCMAPNKEVIWDICENCKRKEDGFNPGLETIAFQVNSGVVAKLNKIFQMPIDYLRQLDNELGSMNEISAKDSYTKFTKLKKFCELLFNSELKDLVKKEFNVNMTETFVMPPNFLGLGGTGMTMKPKKESKHEELWKYLHAVSEHRYDKNKKDKRKLFDELKKGIDEKDVAVLLSADKFEYKFELYIALGQIYLADRVAIISADVSYDLISEEITAVFLHELGHFFTLITTTADAIYKGKYGNHISQNCYKDAKAFFMKKDKKGLVKEVKELQQVALTYINERKSITDSETKRLIEKEDELLVKLAKYEVDHSEDYSTAQFLLLLFIYLYILEYLVIGILYIGIIGIAKGFIIDDIIVFKTIANISRIHELDSKYSEEIYSGYRGLAMLERAADEFVSRYGMGSYLSSGLSKLHLMSKMNGIGGFVNEAHRQIWFFKQMFYLINAFFYMTSPIKTDKEPSIYETLQIRLKRMAQNQIVAFKDPNIPPKIKADLLSEYEDIIRNNELSKKRVKRGFLIELLPTVVNIVLGVGTTAASHLLLTMTDKEIIKMLDSTDELMSNKLYYHSAKLSSLLD